MKCIACGKRRASEDCVIYCAECDSLNEGNQQEVIALQAELSVIDDTLDMVNAPQCGDPFMSPRIARIQMMGRALDKQQDEIAQLKARVSELEARTNVLPTITRPVFHIEDTDND